MFGKRKYKRFVFCMILVVMMLSIGGVSVQAAEFVNKGNKTYYLDDSGKKTVNTLKKIDENYYYFDKKGVMVKKEFRTIKKSIYYFKKNGKAAIGWQTLSGKKYFFNEKGRALKGVQEIDGASYYFSDKGVMETGWKKIGKKWAYFKKKSGKMAKKQTVDGFKIKKSGYVYLTRVQEKQLKAQQKADEVVASVTRRSMSKSQKLRACYNYITSRSFHYIRKSFYAYSGWEYDYGYEMLTRKGGNCYNFACAFALMAKSIGYEPYVVRGMVPAARGGYTPHALVRINGLYYDPEGQWAGWAQGVYGRNGYPMSLIVEASRKI